MTIPFQKVRYASRFASNRADVLACQTLRFACFFGGNGIDQDRFDRQCRHLMISDAAGRLVATVRIFLMQNGSQIQRSYAAQYYDMKEFNKVSTPLVEIGRFCIAEDVLDADILRVAWAALTQMVDQNGVAMLFGCTSFQGTEPARYGRAFAWLGLKHLGPDHLRPGRRAGEVIPFAGLADTGTDPMPPLLRTYLAMGGWVSDHAVVDQTMQTLHVFTCLEVAAVPPARARALRALAQVCPLP